MKRFLLLLLLLSGTIAIAQTTWTGLGANTNWNNTDNWDTNLVPTAADDVIIPTGFTVTLNVAGTVKSIDVQGTSIFDVNTNLTFTDDSSFGPNTSINWSGGTFTSNGSTLTNDGTISILGGNVFIPASTILTNNGAIDFVGGGDIFIATNGVLNNSISGVIDFQGDDSGISGSGGQPRLLNNEGLIKTSYADVSDKSSIGAELINNGGTIQVEVGTLNLSSSGIELNGGVYNVFSGAALDWDSAITISGTFTGVVDGDINWRSTANVLTSASFNFSGNETLKWVGGNLTGGGTLTNESTIEIQSGNVTLSMSTTLTNNGNIDFALGGDIFIATNAILNNTSTGVIDFQGDDSGFSGTGAQPRLLNNEGLIKTSFIDPSDKTSIGVELRNNDGVIQVENGTLNLASPGIELTGGTYNVFSGATLDWDSPILISGTLTGAIDGDFNWRSTTSVLGTATFDFTGNGTVNWPSGSLAGGGVLTNNSIIEIQIGNVFINIATTLINNDKINFSGGGDIFISTDAVLNNTSTGVIDLQGDDSGFSGSGGLPRLLNNEGIIKATFSDITDKATISVELKNNNGIIQVENGTLNLSSPGIELNDGTYNVFADGTLDWDTTITLSGVLSGTVDGIINWRSTAIIAPAETATFDFLGSETVTWASGSLQSGTLVNESRISILDSNITMSAGSTLTNNGDIDFNGLGDIFIGTNAVLNNTETGVIQFIGDDSGFSGSGAVPRILNNAGILRTAYTNDIVADKSNIGVEVTNSGIIDAETGTMSFSSTLDHQVGGVVKGNAIFDLPAISIFTNDGTFAPGASPGTLTVIGNYISTINTILDIELNGLTPDTEHDVLAITGTNVVFEGNVNIIMGFEANQGDTFTIATVSGTNSTENLVTPIIVDYDGKRYTFDVTYPESNSVLLTISDKLDILPPDIITQDITVQLDATGNVSIVDTDVDDGTTDNCTPTNELVFSLDITAFTCADVGDNSVILTVTDNDGNSANATAIVTVEDSINPVVTCPDDIVQSNDSGSCDAVVTFMASATDNCPGVTTSSVPASGSVFPLGTTEVTVTATDASGNTDVCTFNVTINDTENPVVTCPDDIVQSNDSGSCDAVVTFMASATDNCPGVTTSSVPASGSVFPLGTTEVTVTATDASGNTDVCTFNVTINDTENPVVTCPDDIVQSNDSGSCDAVVTFMASATDNCPGVTTSSVPASGSVFPLGTTEVTVTATDASGNTDVCTFNVTINDTENPIVVTQDIIVQLDASGNASIVPADVNDGSSDNCMMSTLSLDVTDFTCEDLGANTVNLIVTDQSSNSASVPATVTLIDNTLPEIICPSDFTVQVDGTYTVPNYIQDGTVVVSDNCDDDLDRVQTPIPGTELGPGSHNIRVEVTDDSGNTAECSFKVTVDDTLSINDNELNDADISLFPNPAFNIVTLKNTSRLELINAEIIDVTGKVISIINLRNMNTVKEISLDTYSSGMYFVKINASNNSITKRLIKQ